MGGVPCHPAMARPSPVLFLEATAEVYRGETGPFRAALRRDVAWLGRVRAYRFAHGAEHALPGPLLLLDSYHCSRLNTNTGRLTPAMFARVVARARHLIGG